MARVQNSFTTEEVLSFLVHNYDIPGGGECSDISDMEDEVEDIDSVVNNYREMGEENANDGFDFDDIRQIDVVDVEIDSGFITRPCIFCKQIVLLFQCCPNIAKSCVLLL